MRLPVTMATGTVEVPTEMYPAGFEYERASNVEDALARLSARPDARPLAGGHGLIPALKRHRTSAGLLVDIGHIDALAGISSGDPVEIGALTTHAGLADAAEVRAAAPVLAEAASVLGDRQVRNRGTIGGNLAEPDPEADLPAAALATDATLVIRGVGGERRVAAAEFFRGPGATALEDDELLTAVAVPARADEAPGVRSGGAYVRKTHPANGFAMVGVGAVVTVEDDRVASVRVAATGATEHAVRLHSVEGVLRDLEPTPPSVEAAAERAGDSVDHSSLHGDHHASGAYRQRLLEPYASRALTTALDRALDGEDRPGTADALRGDADA